MPLYAFACSECGTVMEKVISYELRPNRIPCETCLDAEAEYTMSAPAYFKIGYEQNGRKAVKVDMGNGKKIHRSMTRENFEHKVGNLGAKKYHEKESFEKRKLNESALTKGYQEHLNKQKEKKNAN